MRACRHARHRESPSRSGLVRCAATLVTVLAVLVPALAANGPQLQASAANTVPMPSAPGPVTPRDYVIGTDDVLSIQFWRDKDLSAEVTVRPDGKVTLPLLNDIQAAGLTPGLLRERLIEAAREYIEDPNATVTVKQINSRKVFITGQVDKPGSYALADTTTILQLIAMAGGLKEFADRKNVSLMRSEDGRQIVYRFNYQDVLNRKNLQQNIELKPGDTIVVP